MKKKQLILAMGLATAGMGMSAHLAAEEDAAPTWTGGAELGFVITSGNTETQTVNGKVDVTKDLETWRNNAKLEALNTSENEETSAEKYIAAWKSDYKFDDSNFLFVTGQYEDDRFSGYDYQATFALGYGRRVIESDTQLLDLEAGPGFRRSKVTATEDNEDEGILKLAGKYRNKFSESAEFLEDLTIDVGEDSTISKSVTAIKAQVAGKLAMKVSFTIKHTSEVPEGTKKTDRETALTLVYSI